MSKKKQFSAYGFFIWGLAILFFFYEFFLRVLPATISSSIIPSLDLSIEQFAMIASAYYVTYAFMQIPVGILLDKFSLRLLVTLAMGLCAFGTLWFSFAPSFLPAFIARLFIGLGSSFGFVGLMIVTLNWFPRKYFAFLIGCGQLLGAIGPLVAGGPMALILAATGGNWRLIFLWVALIGILGTVLIGLFIREKPAASSPVVFVDKLEPLGKRIRKLLKEPQIWWILLYAGFVYVTLPLLGAFWGTAYLEARGFEKSTAAFIISMIWVGLATGSPLIGRFSDKMKRRLPLIIYFAIIGIFSSLLVLYTPSTNAIYLGGLFFCIGFAGAGQNLSFALIAENAPKNLRATALGMNNTALTAFAALVPPIVTVIIQHFSVDGKLTEYSFERGLLIIPVCFSMALLIAIFGLRETFCRQQTEVHHIQ